METPLNTQTTILPPQRKMKQLITILFTVLLLLGTGASQADKLVYICDSQASVAYHIDRNCRGLARCKHDILKVSRTDAIQKYGRRLCGYED